MVLALGAGASTVGANVDLALVADHGTANAEGSSLVERVPRSVVTTNGFVVGFRAVQTLVVDLGPALQASGWQARKNSRATSAGALSGCSWKGRRHGFLELSIAWGTGSVITGKGKRDLFLQGESLVRVVAEDSHNDGKSVDIVGDGDRGGGILTGDRNRNVCLAHFSLL
jgi:hypothetical protein